MCRPELKHPLWVDIATLPTTKHQVPNEPKPIRELRYMQLAAVALREDKQRKKRQQQKPRAMARAA
jgi:hypothetical protein